MRQNSINKLNINLIKIERVTNDHGEWDNGYQRCTYRVYINSKYELDRVFTEHTDGSSVEFDAWERRMIDACDKPFVYEFNDTLIDSYK